MPAPTLLASLGFGMINALANILQTLNIPSELIQSLPYVATLIGLAFFGYEEQRKERKRKKAIMDQADQEGA